MALPRKTQFDSTPVGYLTLSRCPPGRSKRSGVLPVITCLVVLGGAVYALLALV